MDKFYIPLENRAIISVTGDDRKNFLQGIISNDVNKVDAKNAIYALILTPQGKFLFDVFVAEIGDMLLLDAEKSRSAELLKKLSMYKLKSQLEILEATDYQPPIALLGADSLKGNPGEVKAFAADGIAFIDPRDAALGSRIIGKSEKILELLEREGYTKKPYELYEEVRVARGIPAAGIELVPEKSFPLQNNLDELHAIDFDKGCYVGQEVTARTKYRGVVRRKLYKLEIVAGTSASDNVVMFAGNQIGEIKSIAGKRAIGLLEVEETEKIPSGAVINAGTAQLKITS